MPLLYSLSLEAESCNPYADQTIEGLASMSGHILEQSGQLGDCGWSDPMSYAMQVQNLKGRLNSLISQVDAYEHKALDQRTASKMKTVKRVLSCVQAKKIDRLQVSCSQSRACGGTIAYVKRLHLEGRVIFADQKVFLCKNFSKLSPQAQQSVILHELTHLCGTGDKAYFAHEPYEFNDPNNKTKNWQRNADHYEFWLNNGFCIPGFDC
jgi:hypothetical protein